VLVAAVVAGVLSGLVAAFTQIQDPAVSVALRVVGVGLALVLFAPAIGAAIGVVGAVPLLAAAAAGRLVDLAGSGRAQGAYGTFFGLLAAAVFVGIDGHVTFARAIVESHASLPMLGGAQPMVLGALARIVPAAVQLAVPWLVTAAVVQIAVGVGSRVATRAAAHAPTAAAAPAAIAMMTASLVGTLAVAMAALVRATW
jgi:type III secretory pathway component EscS